MRLVVPVAWVAGVGVDRVVFASAVYRVGDSGLLVRADGGCRRTCQDMAAPATEAATFAVACR
ncbi:hypothetical protein ACH4S8_44470 [Streptomyces sp. NPDC021080]|uniref:hypothetical protein n=1 Tax=Streptomyces sp. NPDC021080 TaxID=3365110 RepID=UPI00378CC912